MYNNIATIYKATMTAFLIVKNYAQKLYIYVTRCEKIGLLSQNLKIEFLSYLNRALS